MIKHLQSNDEEKKNNKKLVYISLSAIALIGVGSVYAGLNQKESNPHSKTEQISKRHHSNDVVDQVVKKAKKVADDSISDVTDFLGDDTLGTAEAAVKDHGKLKEVASKLIQDDLPKDIVGDLGNSQRKPVKPIVTPPDNGNSNTGNTGNNDNPPVVNSKPVIKAEMKIIDIKDAFNPMDGVSASDNEDGDLTSQIKLISSNVDQSKSGFYTQQFSVTDSSGVTVTASRLVLVMNEAPKITGESNVRVEAGTKFDDLAGMTVNDKEDGDLTDRITVDKLVDTSKVGITKRTFKVTDNNGRTTIFKQTVEVYSEDAIFKGTEKTVLLNSDAKVLDGVTATNKYGDDFTGKIISDTANVDTSKTGIVNYDISVTDKFGHTTEGTVTVNVVDKLA